MLPEEIEHVSLGEVRVERDVVVAEILERDRLVLVLEALSAPDADEP